MQKVSITQFRSNIYKIIDEIIKTGEPVELDRHGRRIRIVAIDQDDKLKNITPHPGTIVGDPEDFVHIDWSHEWKPDENL